MVNGTVFGWGDLRLYAGVSGVSLPFMGQFLSKVRAINWRESATQRVLYGKGGMPIAVAKGEFVCTGTIVVLIEGYYYLSAMLTAIQGSLALANRLRNDAVKASAEDMGVELGGENPLLNTIPVGVGLHYFPSFPLLVSYARQMPGDFVGKEGLLGVDLSRVVSGNVVGLSTSKGFQTLLPEVHLQSVERGARTGDPLTEVTISFTCLGQPTSPTLPFL